MSSKQLDSILSKVPPATASNHAPIQNQFFHKIKEPTERIVAEIPKVLKEEIRNYLKSHPKETERTVLLRALKTIGFHVEDLWIVDNRSRR